jgi:hypothetical protein
VIGGFRVRNKGWFSSLRKDNIFFFLISFSSFHPTVGAIHENVGTNLLLEATDKELLEKSVRHALHAEI